MGVPRSQRRVEEGVGAASCLAIRIGRSWVSGFHDLGARIVSWGERSGGSVIRDPIRKGGRMQESVFWA